MNPKHIQFFKENIFFLIRLTGGILEWDLWGSKMGRGVS